MQRIDRLTLTARRHVTALAVLGLAVGLAALVGCSSKVAPEPPGEHTEHYVVGVPDSLMITILPEPIVQRAVVVRPDGMISVDLIGDVKASGKTAPQIALDIQEKISRFKRDASVTVSVERSLSNAITILGEVRAPRTFPLERDMRVIEALGLVGGTTRLAKRGGILVIRTEAGQTVVHKVNVGAIESGDMASNIPVRGGDLIVAPPNMLARVGYLFQNLLFPFQPAFGAMGFATAVAAF